MCKCITDISWAQETLALGNFWSRTELLVVCELIGITLYLRAPYFGGGAYIYGLSIRHKSLYEQPLINFKMKFFKTLTDCLLLWCTNQIIVEWVTSPFHIEYFIKSLYMYMKSTYNVHFKWEFFYTLRVCLVR